MTCQLQWTPVWEGDGCVCVITARLWSSKLTRSLIFRATTSRLSGQRVMRGWWQQWQQWRLEINDDLFVNNVRKPWVFLVPELVGDTVWVTAVVCVCVCVILHPRPPSLSSFQILTVETAGGGGDEFLLSYLLCIITFNLNLRLLIRPPTGTHCIRSPSRSLMSAPKQAAVVIHLY